MPPEPVLTCIGSGGKIIKISTRVSFPICKTRGEVIAIGCFWHDDSGIGMRVSSVEKCIAPVAL